MLTESPTCIFCAKDFPGQVPDPAYMELSCPVYLWGGLLENLQSLHPKGVTKWWRATAFDVYFNKIQFGIASVADLPGWFVDDSKMMGEGGEQGSMLR